MNTAIVIRHLCFEDLGSLARALAEAGLSIRWVEAGIDDLTQVDAAVSALVIVLGGPIGVNDVDQYPWLETELDWLRQRLVAERPTLGICLGAQLMAAALGARVYPGSAPEIGWAPLRLSVAGRQSALAPLDASHTSMFHWHGDTFDLPDGATLLASTDTCLNQAFSWGHHALALQCHPEIDSARFEAWLIGHAFELSRRGLNPSILRAEAQDLGPRLREQARQVWRSWLRLQGSSLVDRT